MPLPLEDEPTTTATDLAPTRQDRAPLAFTETPGTFDQAWRWASYAAQSSLVPKNYQGKPYDVLTAVQLGSELGLPPMTALQSIAVINGRPGIFGDGLLALILVSPAYRDHTEYFEGADATRRVGLTIEDLKQDATRAVCTFVRRGKPDPVTRTFSVGQAKRAGLFGKDIWAQYPDRMLQMRARALAARDAFPDVLKGVRSIEELHDIPAEATPAAALEPSVARTVQRKSDQAPAAAQPFLAKEPEPVTLTSPLAAVNRTLTRTTLQLTNARAIEVGDAIDEAAVADLEKYAGTETAILFTCRPIDTAGRLLLLDYRLAE